MKKLLFVLLILSVATSYAQVPSYVPTNGLVAYYPFNGNANDESGNGNNGIVNGATLTTDRNGNLDKAYSFDGVNDYIACNNSFYDVSSSHSVNMWVLFYNVSAGGQYLWNTMPHTGEAFVYNWYNNNDNKVTYCLGDGTSWNIICGNQKVFLTSTPNQWKMFTMTYVSNVWKIFINGQLVQEFSSTNNPNGIFSMIFGDIVQPSSSHESLNGKLDDIAIYNRALSQSEITSLYSSNSCIANITNNDTTICTGQPVTLNASNSGNATQNITSLTREWTNSYSTSNGIFRKAIIFDSSMVISGSNWPSWPSGTTDQMITKIGLDGSLKWRNVRAPGADHDGYNSLYRYPSGNLLFFGQENAQGTNYFDGFWTRFDANGNELNYGFFNVAGSTSGTDVKRLPNGKFVFSGPDQNSSYVTLTDTNFNRLVYQTYPTGGWNSVFVLCDSQNIYSIGNLSNSANFKFVKYDTSLSILQSAELPSNGFATANGIYDVEMIDGFLYVVGFRNVNSIPYGILFKISTNGVIVDSLIDLYQSEYTSVGGNNGKIFFAKSALSGAAGSASTLNKIIEFKGNGQSGAQYTLNNGSPFCTTDLNFESNYLFASGVSGPYIIGIPAVEKIKINYSATSSNTYLWSTGATTPSITVSPTATTTYYLTVTDANGNTCRDSVKVTVNAAVPATPGVITGVTDVCPYFASTTAVSSSNLTYSIAAMSTASSYTWTVPAGVTIVSGQGTNSISVSFANTYVSGSISVKANNACGSSAIARSLAVYRRAAATPGVIQKEFSPTSIAAVTNVTGLVSETYRIKKVLYATSYNWSMNRGTNATITHLNPLGVNDTAVTVTFFNCFVRDTLSVKSVSPCSVSTARTAILYANTVPASVAGIGTAGGDFAVCIGTTKTFNAIAGTPTTTQAPIASFRWTVPANAVITSAATDSSSITVSFNTGFTGGALTAKGVTACGVIGTTAVSATLQYLPPTPLSISSSTGSYNACINSSVTYTAIVGAPTTSQAPTAVFRWTRPNNTTITSASADSSSITVRFNTGYIGGTLSVKGQSRCGTQGGSKSQSLTHTGCAVGTKMSVPFTATSANPFEVSLYPNPSAGEFKLLVELVDGKTPTMAKATVKVIDLQGRLIKSFECHVNQPTAIGNELKPGVYMVEVRMGDEVKTVRAVRF